MRKSTTPSEAIIIGAGPIGLETAVQLRRRHLDFLHFDAGQIGQVIADFPPLTQFFSSNERIAIAGVPIPSATQAKCRREEYLAYLRAVADQFDLFVNTFERVEAITRVDDGFGLRTRKLHGKERIHETRNVILATGGTASPRELKIPGDDLPHVTHDLGDIHQYWRERVLIIGGKNSAVEAAIRCHYAGARVTISYRGRAFSPRIKYWLRPELDMLIKKGAIDMRFNTIPTRITPTHVTLASTEDGRQGETIDLEADRVLAMIGYRADMSLCRMLGVELNGDAEVPTFREETMETNVPGVYVAGTASAGTQSGFQVYIENSHIHADRIARAIAGEAPPPPPKPVILAES